MAIQQQQTSELTLLQAIEMVAKDKGIDKARLVKTVEEAILKAAQSVFGADRELEARFNEESGQVDLFQYMTVVDDVADDEREIALEDAQQARPRSGDRRGARLPDLLAPVRRQAGGRAGQGVRRHPAREAGAAGVRAHRGADGEAGAHPARARRRARPHLQRVQGPQGRAHQGRRPPLREGQQPHRRPRANRGHPAVPRADAARDVPPGRPHRRLREGHRSRGARPAGHPQPRTIRDWSRSSSRPRFRKSTKASSRSSRAPASRARARRSPSRAATRTSIRWARASA